MAKPFQELLNRTFLWAQKKVEVARFHGIILADFRRRSQHFQTTLLGSLQLVYDHDPRRFARVQRQIAWIVNRTLDSWSSADYHAQTRTCSIDFREPSPEDDPRWHVARNARTLIHEATHGVLISRGIEYTADSRARSEKLCVKEENRFLRLVAERAKARLQHDLVTVIECLYRDFDQSQWERSWTASRGQRVLSLLRQWRSIFKG